SGLGELFLLGYKSAEHNCRRDAVRQQKVEKSSYAKELEAKTTFELKALTEEVIELMNHSVASWYIDIGDCDRSYEHCGARFWYREHIKRYSKDRKPTPQGFTPGYYAHKKTRVAASDSSKLPTTIRACLVQIKE
ncbi:hypothetical protein Tco_0649461, partial [Tanacetum coccineum]